MSCHALLDASRKHREKQAQFVKCKCCQKIPRALRLRSAPDCNATMLKCVETSLGCSAAHISRSTAAAATAAHCTTAAAATRTREESITEGIRLPIKEEASVHRSAF
eukprot:13650-Heterococcus_DN1.PRE.2